MYFNGLKSEHALLLYWLKYEAQKTGRSRRIYSGCYSNVYLYYLRRQQLTYLFSQRCLQQSAEFSGPWTFSIHLDFASITSLDLFNNLVRKSTPCLSRILESTFCGGDRKIARGAARHCNAMKTRYVSNPMVRNMLELSMGHDTYENQLCLFPSHRHHCFHVNHEPLATVDNPTCSVRGQLHHLG